MLAVELTCHARCTVERSRPFDRGDPNESPSPVDKRPSISPHQPRDWDPEIMGRLTSEMENMIVDKGLRTSAVDTIWEGVITNKYEELRLQRLRTSPILIPIRSRSRSRSRSQRIVPVTRTRARSRVNSDRPELAALAPFPSDVCVDSSSRTEDAYTVYPGGNRGQAVPSRA